MPAIGQYAAEPKRPEIEPDVYAGQITLAAVVMDKDNPALPLTDKWGKNRLQIKVQLEELDDEGNPIELRRQLAIAYGQTGGTYAALAQLIQAVTGVKCGDKAQRNVTTEQLQGAKIRVQTAIVEKDEKTYTNIVGFFAPKKSGALPAGQTPPIVAAHAPASAVGLDEDDLSSLPF